MELKFTFPPTAHWRVLKPLKEVTEPSNPTFINPRALTINERDQMFIPQKHNFKETFQRPKFTGSLTLKDTYANGRLKLDQNKEPILVTTPRKKGIPNPEYLKEIGISHLSRPEDYAAVLSKK